MRSVLGGSGIGGHLVAVSLPIFPARAKPDAPKCLDRLQRAMTAGAGVVRSAGSLDEVDRVIDEVAAAVPERPTAVADLELANLVIAGRALVAVARLRTETRGCHTRTDFPDRSDALRHRLVIR
jgi:L-aspartate oxidase